MIADPWGRAATIALLASAAAMLLAGCPVSAA